MADALGEILLTEEQIRRRVAELGRQISADYAGLELTLVCVLRGAVVFLADLIRHLSLPASIDFMAISSYGSDTQSTGVVRIVKDLDDSIQHRHVLVVEDIVDTGLTLAYLLDNLRNRSATSVRVCALLDKPARRRVPITLDYVGFTLPDCFVVGYGLDFAQRYRGLPHVVVLSPEEVCPRG
ncbi:MAG: hypoxanthine phosphoribosyltransferase [Armatimonadetes bacterium]|nr:hypoxanthine phosphoribosyltransferase [Armatimonadota bacterium]